MNRFLFHPLLLLLLRLFLGGMFIIASLDKIVDPAAFAVSILNYKLIGAWLAMCVATVLPWMELLAGLGLLLGILPRGSALIVTLFMALFTLMVATALARGLDISCGCFSQDPSIGHIGLQKIGENIGLLALALIALRAPADRSLLDMLRRSPRQS